MTLTLDAKTYPELIREFAEHAGLDPASLSMTEEVHIEGLPIGLALDGDEQLGDVVMFASLGKPPAQRWPELARLLLEANHFWVGTGGAMLAVQPDTWVVTLWARIPLLGLDGAGLAEALASFADTALFWRAQVLDEGAGAQTGSDLAAPRMPFDPMQRA